MTTYEIEIELSISRKRGYSGDKLVGISNTLSVPECCLSTVSPEQLEQMVRLLAPALVRMLGACAVEEKLERTESVLVPAGQAAAS